MRLGFWLFIASVAAITAVAIFSDYDRVLNLLKAIEPGYLPLIMAAVLFNYLLRFGKWCYFLSIIQVRIPWRTNLWVFFSSFTMVLSPGKIGELVKSFLLRGRFNIPVAKTGPVVIAERLTDLLGLIVLCLIGFSQFAFGGSTIFMVAALILLLIISFTRPAFWQLVAKVLNRFERLAKLKKPVKTIEESTRDLLSLRALLFTTPLSALSWAGEGVALYLIFQALQVELPGLLMIAIFAHAFSSIVGALSFLPGGLLVTEGTLGMFFVFVKIADAQALSATFLIRAVTLWFAVILGTLVFLFGHRREDLAALQLIGTSEVEEKHG